jgi:thiosulfate/3-mercaptopyruvate sulfurtransferase
MRADLRRDDVLVGTEWLNEQLGDPRLRILDCRYYFDGRDPYAEYLRGHIPGALYFDWNAALSDPGHPVEYMMASPERVAAELGQRGIGDEHLIVAYDDEGGHFGARVWLVLTRYGRGHQVRILEGGWTKWLAEGRPVSAEEISFTPVCFTLEGDVHRELIASLEDVRRAIETLEAVVLDVRRLSEYTGEEVRARRGGHVPGAIHRFWQENLYWDGDRTFRSAEEIRARHEAVGVTLDTPVITYCQGGVRAAHAALALLLSGYQNVKVYEGSWAEWGNRDDVPVEVGPPRHT